MKWSLFVHEDLVTTSIKSARMRYSDIVGENTGLAVAVLVVQWVHDGSFSYRGSYIGHGVYPSAK